MKNSFFIYIALASFLVVGSNAYAQSITEIDFVKFNKADGMLTQAAQPTKKIFRQ